jgi:competence protein ComEA
MPDSYNKVTISVAIFLFLALISGGVILAVRTIGNSPGEIDVTRVEPEYKLEINIGGAVANPGIYPVKGNSTLGAIIETAGLLPESDNGSISIYIHKANEAGGPQKVNLNTAETWLLEALPGIGPGRAEDIMNYRVQNGPFRNITDLMKIKGIGQSVFDKIKDLITVED